MDRSTWQIPAIFSLIGSLGNVPLADLERTLNLGVGMIAIVDPSVAEAATKRLNDRGIPSWIMGDVVAAGEPEANNPDYVQGAKGVDGGAVRLLGSYAS
ncbi:5'-phosphoribosyl-5-aminoimidazole synthetase PurM [Mycobacterium tuberculosis]|nr:5'-phosphoribosyl-5-aminoimidazole synthetase PurM [Mycobacterium tuberculosis]